VDAVTLSGCRAVGRELEPAAEVIERLVEDALKLQEPGDLGVLVGECVEREMRDDGEAIDGFADQRVEPRNRGVVAVVLANGSTRPEGDLQARPYERAGSARKRTLAEWCAVSQ
jgi:hypothetical protein